MNPHAPYTPPPPFDTAFLDGAARPGPACPWCPGFHGGVPKQWAVAGQDASATTWPSTTARSRGGRGGRARCSRRSRARAVAGPDASSCSPPTTARASASTTTTSTTARTCSTRRCAFPLIVVDARARRRACGAALRLHPRPRADDPRRGQGVVSARPRGHEPARRGEGRSGADRERLFAPERPQPERHLRRALQARGHARGRRRAGSPSSTARRDPGETRDVASARARRLPRRSGASWTCSWSGSIASGRGTAALLAESGRASRR